MISKVETSVQSNLKNEEERKFLSVKSVFKGASIYSLGGILVKCSGFFLLPLYTRVLSPEDYGIIGYLTVFSSIASVILGFGFYGAQTRFYYENSTDSQQFGRFAFTINIIPVAIAVMVGGPLIICGTLFDWKISSNQIPFHPFILLILGTVVLEVLALNAVSFYRAQQKFLLATILQVSQFLAVTLFSIFFIVYCQWGALGRIAGMLAGLVVLMFFIMRQYVRSFVWKPSLSSLGFAFAFGGPVVIHLLASSLHNAIDRVMLERFISLNQLGIYTLAFTIGNTLSVFISSFNQAYQPSYFKLMASNDPAIGKKIWKTFSAWLALITAAAACMILAGKPFITIFAGERFSETVHVFPWIVYAVYLGSFYFFFSSPIFYFKKTMYLPLITGISAIVNIITNLTLIPTYGIIGAAVATAFSHLIQSVLAYIIGGRMYRMKWPWVYIAVSMVVVSLSLVFSTQLF